jgi:hypothetical protein
MAASANDARAKVQLTGPLFAPTADATLRQNIRGMLAAVAEEGADTVMQRSPVVTGDFVGGIVGRIKSEKGTPWFLTAVVSATHIYPWANKGQRGYTGRSEAQYRGGKVEGRYRMFKGVTYQLRASRAVMAANITKGLE